MGNSYPKSLDVGPSVLGNSWGVLTVAITLSGSAISFMDEIDRVLNPQLHQATGWQLFSIDQMRGIVAALPKRIGSKCPASARRNLASSVSDL